MVLRDDSARPRTALGRFHHEPREVRSLKTPKDGLLGIRPRNKEQAFALDLLLDDNVKLITLVGKAGTGKTLLALAAGLRRVVDDGAYARLLVSRPVMPLGRDIGFPGGDIELVFETVAAKDWVAASLAGLKPVTAGRFTVHELAEHGAEMVLASFADTAATERMLVGPLR